MALPDLEPYDGDVSSAFREGPASGSPVLRRRENRKVKKKAQAVSSSGSVADVSSPPDLDASSSFTPVEQMLHEEAISPSNVSRQSTVPVPSNLSRQMVLCDAHERLPQSRDCKLRF